jgi:hypothetical protein
MIPRPQVPAAAALGSGGLNLARGIGPAIAGLLVRRIGVAADSGPTPRRCRSRDRVTSSPARPDSAIPERFLPGLRAGGRYVRKSAAVFAGHGPPAPVTVADRCHRRGNVPGRRDPRLFIELFGVPSWEEHLRQHRERQTVTDPHYHDAGTGLAAYDITCPTYRHEPATAWPPTSTNSNSPGHHPTRPATVPPRRPPRSGVGESWVPTPPMGADQLI